MSRFPRPNHTILNITDLKLGDEVWHVYGIWPPFISGPEYVTIPATPFSSHPLWEDYLSGGEMLVFATDKTQIEFANDGNLTPGYSHNYNYWTRSQQDARFVRDYLTQQYNNNPDEMKKEIQRREELDEEDRINDQWEEWEENNIKD